MADKWVRKNPVNIKLFGDKGRAESFIGEGNRLLYQLHTRMNIWGSDQDSMYRILPDGTFVEVKSFGIQDIMIVKSPPVGKQVVVPKFEAKYPVGKIWRGSSVLPPTPENPKITPVYPEVKIPPEEEREIEINTLQSFLYIGEYVETHDPVTHRGVASQNRVQKRDLDLNLIWSHLLDPHDPTSPFDGYTLLAAYGKYIYIGTHFRYGTIIAGIRMIQASDGAWVKDVELANGNNRSVIDLVADANGVYSVTTWKLEKRSLDLDTLIWSIEYLPWHSAFGWEDPNDGALAQDENNLYLTYPSYKGDEGTGWTILKIKKSDGSILWTQTLNLSYVDSPSTIVVDETGIYVGGTLMPNSNGNPPGEWYMERRKKSDGEIIWSVRNPNIPADFGQMGLLWSLSTDIGHLYTLGYYGWQNDGTSNPKNLLEKRKKSDGSLVSSISDSWYGWFDIVADADITRIYTMSNDGYHPVPVVIIKKINKDLEILTTIQTDQPTDTQITGNSIIIHTIKTEVTMEVL